MGDFKAIETEFKSYRFRSRTEARWAVVLETLRLRWEYEREGFVLPNGNRYLPDFWLPDLKLWIEIKGQEPTKEEERKCERLRDGTGHAVLMLSGQPGEHTAKVFCWDLTDSSGGSSEWDVPRILFQSGQIILCIDPYRSDRTLTANEDMNSDLPFIATDCTGTSTLHATGVALLIPESDVFSRACEAGRAARFEFGEKGIQ